jgi:ribosomal protein S18 acetylase RimI-like enzyme
MEFTTRRAREADKEFVYTLNRTVYHDLVIRQFGKWDNRWQRQYFEEKWARARYCLIEHNGRPIGVIWVTECPDYHMLNEIQLLPEFQGQGIGSTLIRQEIARTQIRQIPLRLRVLKQNPRAQRLYARLGFVVSGETETHIYMEYSNRRAKDHEDTVD